MSDVISDQPTLQRRMIAEAAGTALLVFAGCAAIVFPQASAGRHGAVDVVVIAFAFGLALLAGIVTFGRISGGHFNPAVSAAIAASGRMSWREAGAYAAAQVGGAVVAALVLWVAALGFPDFSASKIGGLGATGFGTDTAGGHHAAWWSAFLIEYLLTAVFVTVILSVTDRRHDVSFAPKAIAIAFTLVGIHFAAITATGASVNPARSFGPALFSGGHAIGQLWLYILAPLGGAIAGAGAYVALFGRDADPVAGSGIPSLADLRKVGSKQQVPSWQTPKQASEGQPPVYEQDGWRWDYQAQQWVPAGDGGEIPVAEDTTQIERPAD